SKEGKRHDLGDRIGAYQTFEQGRTTDVSCACHWTVNVAASNGHGKLYADAYSVSPAGIFVPPDSAVREPADLEDVRKYFRALRRAQRDIDLRPELFTHYYKKEMPARFLDRMDTRRWGPGERLVFEPYSKETFEQSFEWIEQHGIFPRSEMGSGRYESSIYA